MELYRRSCYLVQSSHSIWSNLFILHFCCYHAGYTYCGSCAAHAYKQVDPSITRRIFILGPSHHVPLSRCALSSVDIYRTPLYDLRIDQKIYGELWKTGMFERMSLQTDEDEHSIEMHLPYTAKAMERV
ncbi:protein MEMO1 isoform X4 [Crocuta crocuta]